MLALIRLFFILSVPKNASVDESMLKSPKDKTKLELLLRNSSLTKHHYFANWIKRKKLWHRRPARQIYHYKCSNHVFASIISAPICIRVPACACALAAV